MEKYLNAVLIVTFLCFSVAYEDLDINSICSNGGSPGVCKSIAQCPLGIEALRKYRKHNLKRCMFDGFDEIVCCPTTDYRGPDTLEPFTDNGSGESTPSTGTKGQFPNKRKSQTACDNIETELKSNIRFLITDGEDAEQKEFPHMAALGFDGDDNTVDWRCGACIISNNFLLTAAHCVIRTPPVKARVGITWMNDSNPIDINVKNITMYSGYDPLSKHGDIALVELSKRITFNDKAKPACLYVDHDDPLGLIVTGWGKTSINNEDDRSNILQKAKLVAVPVDKCNATYVQRSYGTRSIESTQICAWGNSSDACWGDSGGPLQIRQKSGVFSIVGVVSYGAGCGGKIPGVYTRVSKYIDWIERIVWP